MLKIINAADVISSETETHYALQTKIYTHMYPQVHDYYEIVLVTKGKMLYKLKARQFRLEEGDMLFVRPGEIHSKIFLGECNHINLSFPEKTINALFDYLYDKNDFTLLIKKDFIPPVLLKRNERSFLQARIQRLSLLPESEPKNIRTQLRIILIEILEKYLMPTVINQTNSEKKQVRIPVWFEKLLRELDTVDNLSAGMDYLCEASAKSKEHICRTFRKFLQTTPITYINGRRLIYIANMLRHSDGDIIDLAYDAGFESVSNFYHLFKKAYGISPKKYRLKQAL